MKKISVSDIEGFRIGHAQNFEAATGCTVILCEQGGAAGLEVRGGGPASRETELLKPLAAAEKIHAILLSGGSAFGLDAAGGVVRYLYQNGVGFDTGVAKVPLVCASCIYDLQIGASDVWPDAEMGYTACVNSENIDMIDGDIGVGTGATVGKLLGPLHMMKAGVGSYALQIGDFKIGAIVVVNAVGDIFDPDGGKQLAGLLNSDRTGIISTENCLYSMKQPLQECLAQNTTLGVVIMNAAFNKPQMNKIASMANNGLARTIRPLNTSMDGDAMYAISLGNVNISVDIAGTLASQVVAEAVKSAAISSKGLKNVPSANDFI